MKKAFLLISFLLYPLVSSGEVRICYFSMNNSIEFEHMKKFLAKINPHSPKEITAVEYHSKGSDPHQTYNEMIESANCQGVVKGGVYTGVFSGKLAQGALSVDFLEEASCRLPQRDFFAGVRVLWLQGSRTLGVADKEHHPRECTDIGCYRQRAKYLEEDFRPIRTATQLDEDYSVLLDETNPLGSRYQRVYPRATIFGWTRDAPGPFSGSGASIPYHIAQISRIESDGEFFTDPTDRKIPGPVAANYAKILLRLLGEEEIDEDIAIQGWMDHGLGEEKVWPYSFHNPFVTAFKSLEETGDATLERAKELNCLLVRDELNAEGLEEIVQDRTLIGYTFNHLWDRVSQEQEFRADDLGVLPDYLRAKLDSTDTGLLLKAQYYSYYRQVESITELEEQFRNALTAPLAWDSYHENLFKTLLEQRIISSSDYLVLAHESKNPDLLISMAHDLRDGEPPLPENTYDILWASINSEVVNANVLLSVGQCLTTGKVNLLDANFLMVMVQHRESSVAVHVSVADYIRIASSELNHAGPVLLEILGSPLLDNTSLDAVIRGAVDSLYPVDGWGNILLSAVNSLYINEIQLVYIAHALADNTRSAENVPAIIEGILNSGKLSRSVLVAVKKAINSSISLSDEEKLELDQLRIERQGRFINREFLDTKSELDSSVRT